MEAVLELKFQEEVELDQANRVADKFAAKFPLKKIKSTLPVLLMKGGVRKPEWRGRKRSSIDTLDILRGYPHVFTTMPLARYAG